MTRNKIIEDFNGFIEKYGGRDAGYGWYVGITAHAQTRLFEEHKVTKSDPWIYREADNDTIARNVEKAYLEAGYKGGSGGGDQDSRYVYAYRITDSTVE